MRFDLSLRDRVIVLSDTNGDGQADSRKVFTDDVQMLTSVEVGHGGVWLMCPPKLLFIPDRNGDLIPDGEPEVMVDGFDVARGIYSQTSILESKEIEPYKVSSEIISNSLKQQVKLQSSFENI